MRSSRCPSRSHARARAAPLAAASERASSAHSNAPAGVGMRCFPALEGAPEATAYCFLVEIRENLECSGGCVPDVRDTTALENKTSFDLMRNGTLPIKKFRKRSRFFAVGRSGAAVASADRWVWATNAVHMHPPSIPAGRSTRHACLARAAVLSSTPPS